MGTKRGLVVVANRLPVQRSRRGAAWERSPGGLVTALEPVFAERQGAWVGWAGGAGPAPRSFVHEGLRVRPVSLTDGEVRDYYQGFCNRALWPLFHDAIRTPEFHREWWRSYLGVNRRFAEAASRAAAHGRRAPDPVWVHDFHLLLVPGLVRERLASGSGGARVGFFLHTPFPPEELFAWLPWRREILSGMLGADVVGFQTYADAQNFSRLARRFCGAEGTDTLLEWEGRRVRVAALPISIDFGAFESLAQEERTRRAAEEIRARVGADRKIILCVDRLDYTKGIDTRLHAYGSMLGRGQIKADECVLIQVAVPTREGVADYEDLRDRVEREVGRINGQYSQPGRVAVHYFRRSLGRAELAAYYRAADVMLVTPLRDGMNLVAKEFVACRPDLGGVLVLSEFAGASRQMRRAILVNPRDMDGLAAALRQALRMKPGEARQRMAILRMMGRRHDVFEWCDGCLGALEP